MQLYRHGDRSPTKTYPTNPYNKSVWQQGFGQLTTEGMKQHYALGQYFRKRYIEGQPYKLLSEFYDHSQVHVQSTDSNRMLMSAYSNLAGLFPPQGSQVWNEDLLWQPIPVHTMPKESYYEFYEFMSEVSGIPYFNMLTSADVADPLFCEKTHNLSLPSWVEKEWDGQTTYDKLQTLQDIIITLAYSKPVMRRLTGGPLLGEVVKNMKDKRDGKMSLQQKAFIYSAHDSTVAAFLSAMGIFNNLVPPYASSVLVELFNTSGRLFVEVWYRNSSAPSAEAFQMIIPGCKASCPLDEFISLMQANIPTDWKAECNTLVTSNTWLFITAVIVGLLVLLIIIIMIVKVMQRRREVNRYGHLAANKLKLFVT